jgi:DNA repair exonuclease SbcCD ATPase subunit
MLSNRESARRSRKRKQEQLQELEAKIHVLEQRNSSLEAHCQSVAAHVQKLMDAKQELENENQHLTSIFEQLQVGDRLFFIKDCCASGHLGQFPGNCMVASMDGEHSAAKLLSSSW